MAASRIGIFVLVERNHSNGGFLRRWRPRPPHHHPPGARTPYHLHHPSQPITLLEHTHPITFTTHPNPTTTLSAPSPCNERVSRACVYPGQLCWRLRRRLLQGQCIKKTATSQPPSLPTPVSNPPTATPEPSPGGHPDCRTPQPPARYPTPTRYPCRFADCKVRPGYALCT